MDGYCADMTRTVAVGKPSDKMRKIYDIVLHAQEAAQAAIAPGLKCCDIDAVARNIIAEEGYGECFGHSTGHGVGIDIHEEPRVSSRCDKLLVPGHIITIEPGIYVPGLGGVRIENTRRHRNRRPPLVRCIQGAAHPVSAVLLQINTTIDGGMNQ